MNKKKLFLWALYDFANSIILVNFVLYFAVWIVVDGGLADFWYNAIFAITSIMLLATAPALAARTDKHGGRKKFLNIATIGTFIGYGAAAILAGRHVSVLVVALAFLVGQYFYQLAFVFFNPMLNDIADESHRSRASGIGQFASSLGFVFGIGLTFHLAASRTAPLLPAVIAFFILALPMTIFYKESKKETETSPEETITETKKLTKKMIAFFMASAATPMLVAFFFFNDSLITVSNNYSIYLERVFHVPDTTKSLMLASVLGASAVGAAIGGWVGDKIGPLKTIKLILIAWIILLPLVALAPNFLAITIVTPLTGLLIGSIWTVSRSYLSLVLPKKDVGYGFSFYTIAERFATLIGPLTWGGIIWFGGTQASTYRIAMAAMTVYVIIGLIILHKWRRENLAGSTA
jgi:UMF1 family MFS transporter